MDKKFDKRIDGVIRNHLWIHVSAYDICAKFTIPKRVGVNYDFDFTGLDNIELMVEYATECDWESSITTGILNDKVVHNLGCLVERLNQMGGN